MVIEQVVSESKRSRNWMPFCCSSTRNLITRRHGLWKWTVYLYATPTSRELLEPPKINASGRCRAHPLTRPITTPTSPFRRLHPNHLTSPLPPHRKHRTKKQHQIHSLYAQTPNPTQPIYPPPPPPPHIHTPASPRIKNKPPSPSSPSQTQPPTLSSRPTPSTPPPPPPPHPSHPP